MFKKIVIFSLLALLFGSCIKEDLSDCILRLQFSYTYNNSGTNQLEQVRDIRVYIFGSNGVLFDVVRASQQEIARGYIDHILPSGTYTAVAWGSSSTDMIQGGYQVAEMSNPAAGTFIPEVRIGSTTLNQFRMMLSCVPVSGNAYGDVTPQNEQFDDLFYAIAQNFPVIKGRNQTVDFDFMKNTSTLEIKITGLQYLGSQRSTRAPAPGQPLNVFVTAKNERYGYDNLIDPNSRVVLYDPPYSQLTADQMTVDIKIQRLLVDLHQVASPVELYVQHPDLGVDMIPPLNIVQTLLAAGWNSQEAIDKEDVFPLQISIAYDTSISITINEFEIITPGPNLRP